MAGEGNISVSTYKLNSKIGTSTINSRSNFNFDFDTYMSKKNIGNYEADLDYSKVDIPATKDESSNLNQDIDYFGTDFIFNEIGDVEIPERVVYGPLPMETVVSDVATMDSREETIDATDLNYSNDESTGKEEKSWLKSFCDYVGTGFLSAGTGLLEVVENVGDGLILAGGTVVSGVVSLFDKEESQKIKEGTQGVIQYDWTKKIYDESVDAFNIDEDIAYGVVHNVTSAIGTGLGYIALSALPGGAVVVGAASGLAAAGTAAEQAFNSGATYDEALIAATISGLAGTVSGSLLNKVGGLASTSTKISSVLGYSALSSTITMAEPAINFASQYFLYANDIVDKDGNKVYDNFGDYYVSSGGLKSTILAGGIGFGGTFIKGVKGVNEYKTNVNANMDNMTEIDRSKAWSEYYTTQYGEDNVAYTEGPGLKLYKAEHNANMDNMTEFDRSNAVADYYTTQYGENNVAYTEGAGLKLYKTEINANMDNMTEIDRSNAVADYYITQYGEDSVVHTSGKGLEDYKIEFNADMDNMTEIDRFKAWSEYYTTQYGEDSVIHTSGKGLEIHNGSVFDLESSKSEFNALQNTIDIELSKADPDIETIIQYQSKKNSLNRIYHIEENYELLDTRKGAPKRFGEAYQTSDELNSFQDQDNFDASLDEEVKRLREIEKTINNFREVSRTQRSITVDGIQYFTDLTDDELIKFSNDYFRVPIDNISEYPAGYGIPRDSNSIKFDRRNGNMTIVWGENDGAVYGTGKSTSIEAGTYITRVGNPSGINVCPIDSLDEVSAADANSIRALPWAEGSAYSSTWEVKKDITVDNIIKDLENLKISSPKKYDEIMKQISWDLRGTEGMATIEDISCLTGIIAPDFGGIGQGVQCTLPIRTNYLVELGYITSVK